MKEISAELIISATSSEQFPKHPLKEIAFAGRSNVGKSSLLNSLVHKKNLAFTSGNPGKTRQINFYSIETKYCFVDLPGFGYAAVSKSERKKWAELNTDYLIKRKNLVLTCLLVDSRHDPMDTDLALMETLENNEKFFIVILTKSDKLSENQITDRKKQLEDLLINCNFAIEVLPYSSITNKGREQLQAIIKRQLNK